MKTKAELQKQLAELDSKRKAFEEAHKDKAMTAEERSEFSAMLDQVEATLEELKLADRAEAAAQAAAAPQPAGIPLEIHNLADEAPYSLGEFMRDVAADALGQGKSPRLVAHQKRNIEMVRREFKAATGLNEALPAEGGFLVGKDFAGGLVTRTYNNSVIPPMCQRLSVGAGSNGTVLNGVDETSRADGSRHGGVQGYWVGEGKAGTPTKPKFRRIELNLKKLVVFYYATDELLQDATSLGQAAEPAVSDELGFKLTDAIIRGDGAGKPLGILSSEALTTVGKEAGQSADTIVAANINKMWSRCWSGSRLKAVWLINQEIEPQLDVLSIPVGTGGVPIYMPPGGISEGPYGRIKGRPVIPVEQASALGDVGDITLADFSSYQLIDKGGVQAASSMHVQFLTDEMVFRFVYRVDGQPLWNKPLTPYKGAAANTLSPFVTLAERA